MEHKKYQVFISSTYTDLIDERRKILDVLLMADCIPSGMEAFVATDNEQFEVIKKVIDLCDYYILIIGMRYGSINPLSEKSYTEMEYEYAKEKGIPVLVFAVDSSLEFPPDKCETDPQKTTKLNLFREKALANRLASIWTSRDDLAGKVAIAIMRAKSEINRPGWQRAVNYDEASLRKQIMELTENNKELERRIEDAQNTIEGLTVHSDIAFDDCSYELKYSYSVSLGRSPSGMMRSETRNSKETIFLPQIFESIATEMMDVRIVESKVADVIRAMINCSHTVYLEDKQVVKKILNQLRQLNLVQSTWDEKTKQLYWGLTKRGQKVRDDMILVKGTSKV